MFRKKSDRGNSDYRFILFLADIHAFHAFGLTPSGFLSSTGATISLNTGQRYLLEVWNDIIKSIPEKVDGLFLVGDIGEGQNPAEKAMLLSETDPGFQARGAKALLDPVVERVPIINGKRNIMMVRGSKYHQGDGGGIDEHIGELIQSRLKGPWHSPPWRAVDVNGVLLDVAHHQSYTIRYRSMPLEREYGFKLESFGRARRLLPEDILIVRAHTHTGFRVFMEQGMTCLSLPSMKLQDPFAQGSKTPNRMLPDNLGAVGVKIYKEPVNNQRIHCVPYLYKHPPHEVEVMKFE